MVGIFSTATEFFLQLPIFSDSYRILPTATEFYRQLPIFPTKNVRFFPTDSYGSTCTSPPLSPTPQSRPPTPGSSPPTLPGRPRRAPLAAASHLHKTTEIHRHSYFLQLPNFSDRGTEFYQQLPNSVERDTDVGQQRYLILPTATEFCRLNYQILLTETRWETSSPFHRPHVPGLMAAKMYQSNVLRRACGCAWL